MSVETMKADVLAIIDRQAPQAIALLQDLVRIPSCNPPGDEREVADYCADYLRAAGMTVEQIEPAPRRVSNVARLNGRIGSPTLLFNSHLDTFPPGSEENWNYPPFAAEIHDDTIWGIGSKNMKAGVAAAMFVVHALRNAGIVLDGDLLISQAADEILLGPNGLKEIVDRGMVNADYAVYTESDPPLKIEISHRGLAYVEVTTRGLAKHTKLKGKVTPDGPVVNAIVKMTDVIRALESMEFTNWEPDEYIPGPPIISTNLIEGGVTRNMSADRCMITLDVRFLPCQTPEGIMADVERVLAGLRERDPLLSVEARLAHVALPSVIPADSPIVVALKQAIKEVTGMDMPVGGVSSTSDARWLVLNAGIPTAKFEFQDSESGPNEHMAIDDYMNTIRTYAVLALNLLAQDDKSPSPP
jgi:acetylornithine deacetylase/succinyl-diaminopimelate desuccinylase-like protein